MNYDSTWPNKMWECLFRYGTGSDETNITSFACAANEQKAKLTARLCTAVRLTSYGMR